MKFPFRICASFAALLAWAAGIPEALQEWVPHRMHLSVSAQSAAAPGKAKFATTELSAQTDYERAGLSVLDYNADQRPDLLSWTDKGIALYRHGSEPVADSGLENIGVIAGVAPGDFNNDGFVDLAVLTDAGVTLWANRKGKFEKLAAQLPPQLAAKLNQKFNKGIWLDYDHDNDLDLVLLGKSSALARNDSSAGSSVASPTFSDVTGDFPFIAGEAIDGVLMDVMAGENAFDLAVGYQDRAGVIYRDGGRDRGRDRARGKYEAVEEPAIPEATRHLMAFDWNNDGWTDLAVSHLEYPSLREFSEELESSRMARNGSYEVLLLGNQKGVLHREEQTISLASAFPAFADLDSSGLADLVSAAEGRVFTKTNQGGTFAPENDFLEQGLVASRVAASDWDQDGRTDLAAIGFGGSIDLHRNETEAAGAWATVSLEGVKNLKLAPGARVEVKAGGVNQKRTYQGVPLTFGLGALKTGAQIEEVRITWPDGQVQKETKQPINQHLKYKEAPRPSD